MDEHRDQHTDPEHTDPEHTEPEPLLPRPPTGPPRTNTRFSKPWYRRDRFRIPVCTFLVAAAVVGPLLLVAVVGNRRWKSPGPSSFSGRELQLRNEIISVDTGTREMVMSWVITSDPQCNVTQTTPGCSPVSIFLDQISDQSPPTPSNTVPSTPIFAWDPTLASNSRASPPSFRTTLLFSISESPEDYPFDEYVVQASLFALDSANQTVGLSTAPVIGIGVGVSVNSKYYTPTSRPGDLAMTLNIKRGLSIRTYVLFVVITSWTISVIFLSAMIMQILFGYMQTKEFLVLPIATLFTVTQIRATIPGIPDFGTQLDFFGILPALAILSVCAALSVGSLAFQMESRPKDKRQPKKSEESSTFLYQSLSE